MFNSSLMLKSLSLQLNNKTFLVGIYIVLLKFSIKYYYYIFYLTIFSIDKKHYTVINSKKPLNFIKF